MKRRNGGKQFLVCPDCNRRQVYRRYRDGDDWYVCRSSACGFICYAEGGPSNSAQSRERLEAVNRTGFA